MTGPVFVGKPGDEPLGGMRPPVRELLKGTEVTSIGLGFLCVSSTSCWCPVKGNPSRGPAEVGSALWVDVKWATLARFEQGSHHPETFPIPKHELEDENLGDQDIRRDARDARRRRRR